MNKDDLLRKITGAIVGEENADVVVAEIRNRMAEAEYGPAVPLNDESAALYRDYLANMDPDCERLVELKAEARALIARMDHTKEVFMHKLKRMQPELKNAEGIKLDETSFTFQASYPTTEQPLRESPQWVKDILAQDDGTVH